MTECICEWSGKMLDNLSYEEYLGAIGSKFTVDDPACHLELIEAGERCTAPHQEMFALTFGGAKDKFLEQKIYRLRHERLGEGDIFLVPVGEDAEMFQYEANFNRLTD